uniref:Uncharacterized protein n=1 Tax=Glossina pallidipes TaxID=7398 RepID=A0A1B0AEH4_GLOPL
MLTAAVININSNNSIRVSCVYINILKHDQTSELVFYGGFYKPDDTIEYHRIAKWKPTDAVEDTNFGSDELKSLKARM